MTPLLLSLAILLGLVLLAVLVTARLRYGQDDDRAAWRQFERTVCCEVEGRLQRHTILGAIKRRGFTLIELLVVITIIGMLASITLAALWHARGLARQQKTRATITKINDAIMSQYAEFRVRRVPLDTTGQDPQDAATLRLCALRQLMRLEMPDRWSDVKNTLQLIDVGYLPALTTAQVKIPKFDGTSLGTMRRPALSQAYLRRVNATAPTDQYGAAECLYMIVSASGEAREKFQESEIADLDNDTYPEFIDGWGNPIYWIRWAPGFTPSGIQANVISPEDVVAGLGWTDPTILTRREAMTHTDHDPFDPLKVDRGTFADPNDPPRGWRLLPLIYSAGPDGIYDIQGVFLDATGDSIPYRGNPYLQPLGLPADLDNTSATDVSAKNGRLDHYDNLTNHGA